MDRYIQFNALEGALWMLLAGVAYIVYRLVSPRYNKISIVSMVLLLLFGISDFLEIGVGNFLEPDLWWLFAWKVACVIGLVAVFVWYVWLKLYPPADGL